jgi:hypothetical protein
VKPDATVEQLLAQIAAIPPSTQAFDLLVPEALTLQGNPIPSNLAMTILLDALLAKGLFPDGFEPRDGARLYRYRADA